MPYQQIDDDGNPVMDDDNNPVTIEDPGSWDLVKGQIPEDLAEEKLWDNVKDVPGLLKSYAHAQKKMGGAVTVPAADASDDEWNEFYGKLGRPDDPAGYEAQWPEREGLQWDPELQEGFVAMAHKIGLNKAQVNALIEFEAERQGEVLDTGAKALKAAGEELQGEWGGNFNRNLAYAQRAMTHIGGAELKEVMDKTGLGNNTVIAKAFYKIGKMMVEDGVIPGEVAGAMDKNAALAKISEIYADANHPYHKADPAAVEEMRKLNQIAYNE